MYRHDPNPSFWETVKARKPGDGGETESFRARYRALTTDEFAVHDLGTEQGAREFLVDVLQDIDQVEAADGKPLTFTAEVRDSLIRTPHVRTALVKAYLTAFREALAGN